MKKQTLILLFFFIFLIHVPKQAYTQAVLERVIARVNGTMISQLDFQIYQEGLSSLDNSKTSSEEILESLIDLELLNQIAQKYSLEVEENEILQSIKNYKKNLGLSNEQDFKKILINQGIPNINFLKIQLKKNHLQSKLIHYIIKSNLILIPKESEIRQLYKKQKSELKEDKKVKLSHIFIEIKPEEQDNYQQIQAKEIMAKKIVQLLQGKKASFENLAIKYSNDPKSKARGGTLGWYNQNNLSKISSEYGKLAFELEIGQISELIWTKQGIHLIKILDKKPAKQLSYQEARDYLKKMLLQQKAIQQLARWVEIKKKLSIIEKFEVQEN